MALPLLFTTTWVFFRKKNGVSSLLMWWESFIGKFDHHDLAPRSTKNGVPCFPFESWLFKNGILMSWFMKQSPHNWIVYIIPNNYPTNNRVWALEFHCSLLSWHSWRWTSWDMGKLHELVRLVVSNHPVFCEPISGSWMLPHWKWTNVTWFQGPFKKG